MLRLICSSAAVRDVARHRPVAEMLPEFREGVIEFGSGNYIALYRSDDQGVVILAVRHGRGAGD